MNGKGYKIRMLSPYQLIGRVLRKQKASPKANSSIFSCQTLLELHNGPGFMLRLNYKFTSSYPKPVYIIDFFVLLNTKEDIFKNVCNKADLGHLSSTSRGKEVWQY